MLILLRTDHPFVLLQIKEVKVKYKQVALNTLVPSPYNPPSRENKTEVLANNIRENGLLVPIVVANDMTIVDGHRRHMAFKHIAKKAGVKESSIKVPVVQHNSDSHEMYDKMFLAANTDTMLINGHQYLWRYLKGAPIPNSHLVRIKWMERALGEKYAIGMFRRILDFGGSANTYQQVMGVYCRYTGVNHRKSKIHMRKLGYYLLNVESPYRVKSSMAHFIPVSTLKKSVISRKKLNAKFTDGATR